MPRTAVSWTQHQKQILERERKLLADTEQLLGPLDATDGSRRLVERSRWHLEELFMVVVVGEFNSGKSRFINSLLGTEKTICPVGVTPTTNEIQIIKHISDSKVDVYRPHELARIRSVGVDVDWLKNINVVDTPGTNAIIEGHQELTEEFVPRADLVLFVTSAERPFTDSERKFLSRIASWKKKIVIVLNKIDILEQEEQLKTVIAFIQQHAITTLDFQPQIFLTSAKSNQGIEDVRRYISGIVQDQDVFVLKLENPLGVVQQVLNEFEVTTLKPRKALLQDDLKTIGRIHNIMKTFRSEMDRDLSFQEAAIDNVLLRLLDRADDFILENLRFANFSNVMNPTALQGQFEKDVSRNFSREVEDQIGNTVTWLLEKTSMHSQEVFSLVLRKVEHQKKLFGEVGMTFSPQRAHVLMDLKQTSRTVIESFDQKKEGESLANSMKNAVLTSAATGISAVGIGAAVASLAAFDLTGMTGAGVLALTSLVIIPRQRITLKKNLRTKVNRLRQELKNALKLHFERELDASANAVLDSVSPYTNLVTNETKKLDETQLKLMDLRKELVHLRSEIQNHKASAE
jgi:small GTP-binding protein